MFLRYVVSIGSTVLLSAQITHAAEYSIGASVGSSTYSYEYSYPYTDYNNTVTTYSYDEEIDFGYQDLSLNIVTDDGGVWTVKVGGLPEENGYDAYYAESSAKRDETSITYTKRTTPNVAWFGGYYTSEATLSKEDRFSSLGADYTINYDTKIETSGLFGGFTYNEPLNDIASWYARAALQMNWTTFNDDYSWSNTLGQGNNEPFSRDLDGTAVLLAAGIYVPVNDQLGVNFGYETKSYDYDNELSAAGEEPTTLSEDQSSFNVSVSYGF